MSTQGSAANLIQAMKDLSVQWQQTKEEWRDGKSIEFEGKYLENLPAELKRATEAMEEVNTLLKKVRRDCE